MEFVNKKTNLSSLVVLYTYKAIKYNIYIFHANKTFDTIFQEES